MTSSSFVVERGFPGWLELGRGKCGVVRLILCAWFFVSLSASFIRGTRASMFPRSTAHLTPAAAAAATPAPNGV